MPLWRTTLQVCADRPIGAARLRQAKFKATLPRLIPAGDIGDTDVYGAQQHAPLLDVEIPV